MDPTQAIYREPVIQQPLEPGYDDPEPLPDFVWPETGTDEQKPRVMAVRPRVRGKRNPVKTCSCGGQEFVQYRMPADWTVQGFDKAMARPTLPVVLLTDRQVSAILDRAKLETVSETFRPPETDLDALRGNQTIPKSELIVITDYVKNADPFALALQSIAAQEAAMKALDPEPVIDGADELQKTENAVRQSNGEPQRGEQVAEVAGEVTAPKTPKAKKH